MGRHLFVVDFPCARLPLRMRHNNQMLRSTFDSRVYANECVTTHAYGRKTSIESTTTRHGKKLRVFPNSKANVRLIFTPRGKRDDVVARPEKNAVHCFPVSKLGLGERVAKFRF